MASRLQAGGTYVDSFRLRSHEVAETACPYKSDVQHETHGGNYPQEVVFRRHATVPRPLWGRPRPWLQPTQTAMLTPASCAERRREVATDDQSDTTCTSYQPQNRTVSDMGGRTAWVVAVAALAGVGGGTEPGSIPSHLSERTWDLEEELWYVEPPPHQRFALLLLPVNHAINNTQKLG